MLAACGLFLSGAQSKNVIPQSEMAVRYESRGTNVISPHDQLLDKLSRINSQQRKLNDAKPNRKNAKTYVGDDELDFYLQDIDKPNKDDDTSALYKPEYNTILPGNSKGGTPKDNNTTERKP